MVEQRPDALDLDAMFKVLGHSIRRDNLEQLADGSESVCELAQPHDVSLQAVSKHLRILEDADLLDVDEDGRVRRRHLDAAPLSDAFGWLTRYRVLWEGRSDALADHLETEDR